MSQPISRTDYLFEKAQEVLDPRRDIAFYHILPHFSFPQLSEWYSLKAVCTDFREQFNDKVLLRLLKTHLPHFADYPSENPDKACQEIRDRYRVHCNFQKGVYIKETFEGKEVAFKNLPILPEHELFVTRPNLYPYLWNRTTKEYARLTSFGIVGINPEKIVLRKVLPAAFVVVDRSTNDTFSILDDSICLLNCLAQNRLILQEKEGHLSVWDLMTKNKKSITVKTSDEIPLFINLFNQPVVHDQKVFCSYPRLNEIQIFDLNTGESRGSLIHTLRVGSFLIKNEILYSQTQNIINIWNLHTNQHFETIPFRFNYRLVSWYEHFLCVQDTSQTEITLMDISSRKFGVAIPLSMGGCIHFYFKNDQIIDDQNANTVTLFNFAASDATFCECIAYAIESALKIRYKTHRPMINKILFSTKFNKLPPKLRDDLRERTIKAAGNDWTISYFEHLARIIREHFNP